MESGIYIARIAQITIFANGINSSGNNWIIFLLTLEIPVNETKHFIKYRQPSWTIADMYAEFFGSAKNDFNNWYDLHDKSIHVYLQEYEDPIIINFLITVYRQKRKSKRRGKDAKLINQ